MSNPQRIQQFCLSFPDTKVVLQFGYPFYKWRDKPFCVFSDENGENLSIKVEMEAQPIFLADPRFTKTPYIGHRGWVTLSLPPQPDWEEIEELIRGSYLFVSTTKPKAKKKQK